MLRLHKIALMFVSAALIFVCPAFAGQDQDVEEPSGYRLSDYGGQVPLTVKGAQVIEEASELQEFLENNDAVVLLDVYPAPRKPDNLPSTELWIEPKRETLPEAIWLANTGMGVLPSALEDLFKHRLDQLTRGDKGQAVVIFCEPECWHSWNAAKRAASLGYSHVYWYRQGVDGWRKAGLPLKEKEPVRP
ncbi:PQQ-dependent catabolism-associated CXXCW motif protein [Emcibacter sp.]|uniref:PQQ-dependent catabolism-associated CXXCW motif protein n=1 Tax=Emcibacter sp. TaxID=1979954 RepID=UPI003A90C6BC